jgi:hypothetical protein
MRPFIFASRLEVIHSPFSIFNSPFPKGVAAEEEMKPVPMETEASPMETEPAPMETEALPMERKPVSMETEAFPMEITPVPMERKAFSMETEPVPTEKGFISSSDFSVLRPETDNANILIN